MTVLTGNNSDAVFTPRLLLAADALVAPVPPLATGTVPSPMVDAPLDSEAVPGELPFIVWMYPGGG